MRDAASQQIVASLSKLLCDRFVGRTDCYLSEKRKCLREPLTPEVLARHLRGEERIGSYPDGMPKFLGLDHDGKTPKKSPKGKDAAWREVQAVAAVVDADLGLGPVTVELSRSGIGFHVIRFYDPSDLPTFEEHKRFGRLLLQSADLRDDESEARGSPGIYPHPPGPKLTGKTPYLPWFGIASNGSATAARFVDLASGLPLDPQEAALRDVRLLTRTEILEATRRLEVLVPPEPQRPALRRAAPREFEGTLTPYAAAALRGEAERVRCAAAGGRHPALIAAASALGELVAGGALPRALVESELSIACDSNGLIDEGREDEVRRTIADGIAKGAEHPRAPDPPPATRSDCVPNVDARDRPRTVEVEEPPVEDLEEPEWIREGEDEDDGAPIPQSSPQDEASRPASPLETLDLPESCWRHGFREFRAAWSGSTEAPDAYLWAGFLTAAGLMLGRDAILPMGMDVYPNIWSVLVGKTGKPRKTTAQNMGARLVRVGDESVIHLPGIGSAEGLLDVFSHLETEIDATGKVISQVRVGRRRVLLRLAELSSLLRKCRQEATANLGATLTTLYDCPEEMRLPNRQRPIKAEEPFLAVSAGTTAEWLQRDLHEDDVHGGLANRFMIIVGSIKGPLPLPPGPVVPSLDAAERILREARDRHTVVRRYDLGTGAREVFRTWYIEEHGREYASPVLGALSARLHTHVAKVALVFAAVEGTPQITEGQMQAAVEFGDYQRKAQAAVFTGFGDPAGLKIERRIVDALRRKGPLPGWGIQQAVRHVAADELCRRIKALAGLGRIEERKKGRGRVWALQGDGS